MARCTGLMTQHGQAALLLEVTSAVVKTGKMLSVCLSPCVRYHVHVLVWVNVLGVHIV
jgi:hypothetical protein